ncbi:hypothetical protein [Phormidesmis sp. 146-33]
MNILVDSFFAADADGHGGNHRTAQIAELIAEAGIEITNLDRKIVQKKLDRLLAGLQSILNPSTLRFINQHQLKISKSPVSLAFCGFQRQLYQKALQQHTGAKVMVWEATKNYVAPYVADERHFKIVGVPQNLEALVTGQNAFFESFDIEAQALAKADIVFCIAREEEWLLRLKGVNAHFLPYYPPAKLFERLLSLREARTREQPSRFLILGNAKNPPTKAGMIEQLNWLQEVRKTLEFQVDIVGFGTDELLSYCNHSDFFLHGAVELEKLNELMLRAKAALIHQQAGAGAITRIPEMLIAGIPVIANGNACRSAFTYAGVYCYDDRFELTDLMAKTLERPEVLPRPVKAEKRFINCLLELAH